MVQRLDDVTALAHPAEDGLQVLGQTPLAGGDFVRQTKPLQFLQPPGTQGLTKTVLVSPRSDYAVGPRFPQEAPVQAGEAFLLDFCSEAGLDFVVGARTEIEGCDLCGSLPHASTQILSSNDEVLASIVLSSEDDVGVRMASVVMVNRDPIEFCAEILLHLEHEAAGQRLQIWIFDRILCADDETKLMTVAIASVEKSPSIGAILLGIIGIAGRSFPRDAIALEVPQVSLCTSEAGAGQSYQPRLDDDPAATKCAVAIL